MVSPKHKALELDNRDEIINAFIELKRARPDKAKVSLLISTFNELSGNEVFTVSSFYTCTDCRRSIYNFWKYIILEWSKK